MVCLSLKSHWGLLLGFLLNQNGYLLILRQESAVFLISSVAERIEIHLARCLFSLLPVTGHW